MGFHRIFSSVCSTMRCVYHNNILCIRLVSRVIIQCEHFHGIYEFSRPPPNNQFTKGFCEGATILSVRSRCISSKWSGRNYRLKKEPAALRRYNFADLRCIEEKERKRERQREKENKKRCRRMLSTVQGHEGDEKYD